MSRVTRNWEQKGGSVFSSRFPLGAAGRASGEMLVCVGGQVKVLCYILHEPPQTPAAQQSAELSKIWDSNKEEESFLTILNISCRKEIQKIKPKHAIVTLKLQTLLD